MIKTNQKTNWQNKLTINYKPDSNRLKLNPNPPVYNEQGILSFYTYIYPLQIQIPPKLAHQTGMP